MADHPLTRKNDFTLWLWLAVLSALVCGPLLISRGFALVGDMVFVPRQPWKEQWLSADGSVPRAVPSDALVSLVTQVLPGDIVQKAVLFGLLFGGAWGIARLVDSRGRMAQVCAASLFVWNPFVYERLAIGHWALLCGYAALPWVVVTAVRVRDRASGGLVALGVPLLVASWTSPTGGALASTVALAVVLGRPQIAALIKTGVLCLLMNLPWIVPGLVFPGDIPADRIGVAAFAATPDTPFGTLGSLVTFGGMWKTSVSAPGRSSWLLPGLMLALVVAALATLLLSSERRSLTVRSLGTVSALALLLAWLPSTALAEPWFTWAVGHVPGGGLLRDSQKWVAPLIVLTCLGLAVLVERLTEMLSARRKPVGLLFTVALLPLALLPGMAWGQFGRLAPVGFPDEWATVAAQMQAAGAADGRSVVLPFEIYRRFPWNGERAVLDPAPRYFPGEVLINDVLRVRGGAVVAGEDESAARIAATLTDSPQKVSEVLHGEGVGWVLVEKDVPGALTVPDVPGRILHEGPHLRLVQLPHVEPGPAFGGRGVILGVDCAVVLLGLAVLVLATWRRTRGYTS